MASVSNRRRAAVTAKQASTCTPAAGTAPELLQHTPWGVQNTLQHGAILLPERTPRLHSTHLHTAHLPAPSPPASCVCMYCCMHTLCRATLCDVVLLYIYTRCTLRTIYTTSHTCTQPPAKVDTTQCRKYTHAANTRKTQCFGAGSPTFQ